MAWARAISAPRRFVRHFANAAAIPGAATAAGTESFLDSFHSVARGMVVRRGWHTSRLAFGCPQVWEAGTELASRACKAVTHGGCNMLEVDLDAVLGGGGSRWEADAFQRLVHRLSVPRDALVIVGTLSVQGAKGGGAGDASPPDSVHSLPARMAEALQCLGLEHLDLLVPSVPASVLRFTPADMQGLLTACEGLARAGAIGGYGVGSSAFLGLDEVEHLQGQPLRSLFQAAEAVGGASGHHLTALRYTASPVAVNALTPLYTDAGGSKWSLAQLAGAYGMTQLVAAPLDVVCDGKSMVAVECPRRSLRPGLERHRQLFEACRTVVDMEEQWEHRFKPLVVAELEAKARQVARADQSDDTSDPPPPAAGLAHGASISALIASQAPQGQFGSLRGPGSATSSGSGTSQAEQVRETAQAKLAALRALSPRDQTWGTALSARVRFMNSLASHEQVWAEQVAPAVETLVDIAACTDAGRDWARVYRVMVEHLRGALYDRVATTHAEVCDRVSSAVDATVPEVADDTPLHAKLLRLLLAEQHTVGVLAHPVAHGLEAPMVGPDDASPAGPGPTPALSAATFTVSPAVSGTALQTLSKRLPALLFPEPPDAVRPQGVDPATLPPPPTGSASGDGGQGSQRAEFDVPTDARTASLVAPLGGAGVALAEGVAQPPPESPAGQRRNAEAESMAARMARLRAKLQAQKKEGVGGGGSLPEGRGAGR